MFEKSAEGGGAQVAVASLPPDVPGLGGSTIFQVSNRGSLIEAAEKFGSIVNFSDLTRAHSTLLTDPDKDIVT